MEDTKKKHPFLKKGEGKLASHNHGKTEFALKRQESIEKEQRIRELRGNEYVYNKKYGLI